MADITTFIRGLAGQQKASRDVKPDALAKFGPTDALESVIAGRRAGDFSDGPRVAYEKLRQTHEPFIDGARQALGEAGAVLSRKMTEVDDSAAWDDWKAASDGVVDAYQLARSLVAEQKKLYEDAMAKAGDAIADAIDLTETGGAQVSAGLSAVQVLAKAGRWREARLKLEGVDADARKVNARAPFVRSCRRHEATIKAAFGITHDGLGAEFKAAWAEIVKTAESGAYESAAQEVDRLRSRIDKAKESKALQEKRKAVQDARADNVAAMKLAVESGDVAAARKLVMKEIAGDGEAPSFAAQATAVGDDPGARTREPIGDAASAEELFKKNDWFALKAMLHSGAITQDAMWDCWRYRREYVVDRLDELRKTYPTLIAQTSGSNDLESDIDITFAASEPGDDVKAAAAFNRMVKAKFGKPPGRVFDVNIYPRDYNAIEESINPDYNINPVADRNIDQPGGAMQKMSRVDQDVATLLKQRRFLDGPAFVELMKGVIAGAPDQATKKQIRKQFEEGEAIFLQTASEKIDRIKAQLLKDGKPLPASLNAFDGLREKGGLEAATQAQVLLPKVLDDLEAQHPAEVMEATDEVYLGKMAALRQDQTKIAQLDDPAADPEQHHEGKCDKVHAGVDHEVWRASEADRLKAQVKKAQFTNIVFANEAYMSQGAIEHVVAGIQAKDPARKEAVLAKLTPATLVQSCNEQLADFFKDMKAVEAAIAAEQDAGKKRRETGAAFVHASKYLVRLLDAADILAAKFAQADPPAALEFSLLKVAKVKSARELQVKVEAVLLALRKSSTVPADAKGEVGFDEARALFGVDDIVAFRKLITGFGVELNQQARRNTEFKAELAVDQQAERQYFGVPPVPDDLKALLDGAAAALDDSFGEGIVLGALAEAEGEIDAAAELLEEAGSDGKLPAHLVEQLKDAAIRAEHALGAFTRIKPTAVLADGAHRVQDLQSRIGALEGYDDEDLHDAHVGDIARMVERLRAEVSATRDRIAELGDSMKEIIPELSAQLAKLKKRAA